MLGAAREKRRGPPRESRRDRLLESGLDLERRERQPLAFRGQRTRRRRDALPLRERSLERSEPLPGRAGALGEIVALCRSGTCERPRLVRALLELGRARSAAASVRAGDVVLTTELPGELGDGLLARAKPLPRGAERDERAVGVAVPSGQLAHPPVDRLALAPDGVEAHVRLVGDRTLGRCEQRVRVAGALGRVPAPRGRVTRSRGGGVRRVLERAQRLVGSRLRGELGIGQVVMQAGGEAGDGLAPHGQALAGAPKTVERSDGGLARTRCVRELDLRALPLAEHGLESLLRRAPRERGGGAALVCLGAACVERGEVEPRKPRPKCRDLADELLRPLGRGCLEGERAQALAHLLLDVAGALDLRRDARQLELRAMSAPLELPEAGGLLDQRPAILGLRGEHRVDLSLADDRVHRPAEADVGEQLDEVGAPDG